MQQNPVQIQKQRPTNRRDRLAQNGGKVSNSTVLHLATILSNSTVLHLATIIHI